MITIIFGRAAQFVLALMMMRVATTLLSPEEMGRVSLVVTTTACFAMFLVSPAGMFINRRLHAWRANGMARYYLTRYVAYLLIVAVLAATSLLLLSQIINFGLAIGWLVTLVCGSLFFSTISLTAIPSLNMLGESKQFIVLMVVMTAASFVCAMLLVYWTSPLAQYWLLGQLVGQTLISIWGIRQLFKLFPQHEISKACHISRSKLTTLSHFAWPVALSAGLGWIQGQGYRYLLEGQLGLAELGLFVAGYGISAGMIAGFESVLTAYFQPRLYQSASSEHPAQQAQAWQLYAAAVIPSLLLTVALIVLLAPELTRIFLGEHFQLAAKFVIWGALAEAARVLIGVYSLVAHLYMQTRWLIYPNLIGALLSIILSLLLIPYFASAGAGMALVVSGFCIVFIMHISLSRHVGGGTPTRPVMQAIAISLMLWGIVYCLRYGFSWVSGETIIGIIVPTGCVYLLMQYLILRRSMAK